MAPITSIDDPRYVKAMSHPVRTRIMAMLRERQASPTELSQWLGAPLDATAYHVRKLHSLGLIALTDETRVRGAIEHHYRAAKLSLRRDGAASPVAKQADTAARLRDIETHTSAAAAAGGFDGPDAQLIRRSAKLDDQGWQALAAECRKLLERIDHIEQQAAKRIAKTNHNPVRDAGVVVLAFDSASIAGQIPDRPAKKSQPVLNERSRKGLARDGKSRPKLRDIVIGHLRGQDATVSQIAKAHGLHTTAVRRVLDALVKDGQAAVVDHVRAASNRGRPAALYRATD